MINESLELFALRGQWNIQTEILVSIWIYGSGKHGNSQAGNKYFGVFGTQRETKTLKINEIIRGVFVKGKEKSLITDLWGTQTFKGWSLEEEYAEHFFETK